MAGWKKYIDQRYSVLPEEFQFTDKMRRNFQKMYRVFRERKVGKLRAEHMLDFFNEYAKYYRFEVPIDHEILIKQIHPYTGNLLRLHSFFECAELEQMFEKFLVASWEKVQGQFLLSSEICAFAYWTYRDPHMIGTMSLSDFLRFLRVFDIEVSAEGEFGKEFEFALQQNSTFFGEKPQFEAKTPVPFDFFRAVYLERNL